MAKSGKAAGKKAADGTQTVASNRKARHDYLIEDTWEAGLVLMGTEVKALRMGRASLVDGYAAFQGHELWLEGVHIPEYVQGTWTNHTPRRRRKLLLHRRENRTKSLHGLQVAKARSVGRRDVDDDEIGEGTEQHGADPVVVGGALEDPPDHRIVAPLREGEGGSPPDVVVDIRDRLLQRRDRRLVARDREPPRRTDAHLPCGLT